MRQVMPARIVNLVNGVDPTLNSYGAVMGMMNANQTNEFYGQQIVPTAGTFRNFVFYFTVAPGADTNYTWDINVRVNGSTVQTAQIVNSETTAVISNDVSVSAGDKIGIEFVPSSNNVAYICAQTTVEMSCDFESSTSGESIVMGSSAATTVNISANRYGGVWGTTLPTATEADFTQIVPTAGVFKNLYVELSADAGTSPDAYRFTLKQNGSSSALTCTVVADNTTGSDLSNTVNVSAEDYVVMMVEPVDTPSGGPRVKWSMVFAPTVDGESLIMGGSTNALNASTTEYNCLGGQAQTWASSENFKMRLKDCTLKKLAARVSVAPGSGGDSFGFSVAIDGTSGTLLTTITDAAVNAIDVTNSDYVDTNNTLSLKCDPDVTPGTPDAYWGVVVYVAVSSGTVVKDLIQAGIIAYSR